MLLIIKKKFYFFPFKYDFNKILVILKYCKYLHKLKTLMSKIVIKKFSNYIVGVIINNSINQDTNNPEFHGNALAFYFLEALK